MTESKEPKQPELVAAEGKMWVQSSYKDGDGNVTEVSNGEPKTILVRKFLTQPASVYVGMGLTIPPKQYWSIKVDVGLTLPCYAEEKDACFKEALAWAEAKIAQERESIMSVLKKSTGL